MTARIALWAVAAAVLLSGCARVAVPKIHEYALCKAISDEGVCVSPSRNFRMEDPAVHFFLDMGPMSHEVTLRCVWREPSGAIYSDTEPVPALKEDFRERVVSVCSLRIPPIYDGRWSLELHYEAGVSSREIGEPLRTIEFWVRR